MCRANLIMNYLNFFLHQHQTEYRSLRNTGETEALCFQNCDVFIGRDISSTLICTKHLICNFTRGLKAFIFSLFFFCKSKNQVTVGTYERTNHEMLVFAGHA
jgi:hypothetical protein